MTEKTISSPLRRTAAALARTAAAGSLAGLAVAAFAAPAQAGENRDWGTAPDTVHAVAADDKIWGVDDKIWSVTPDNRDMSVRITGDGVLKPLIFQAPYSVRITGVDLDNRDMSVTPDNRDMSVAPDNRDMGATPDNRDW
ncbi:hypothetical protein K3N28_13055 [Glycomyces sp. TRM65418]|uniref:hypothetical protein n=1 Tax=Glycomyces sp. TRM65418 TaxID=2867006 RepID=UPI001CE54568|nr:hypothetical protein [Glycomyces sp. TRM65418]MCC3763994.1 hypothetical protein [Glycomyces sp. TRM65418]QZD53690.1 hypothetical protein K3N28_12985 [Glycomyces sp. TRM65418]